MTLTGPQLRLLRWYAREIDMKPTLSGASFHALERAGAIERATPDDGCWPGTDRSRWRVTDAGREILSKHGVTI